MDAPNATSAETPSQVKPAERLGYLGMALFLGSLLMTPVEKAEAATFTVTNNNDNGAGSLRQAILDANATGGVDDIVFDPSVTGFIQLTSGQMYINEAVNINGPGDDVLTIDADDSSRIFYLHTHDNVNDVLISGLTLADGATLGNGGAILSEYSNLAVTDCTFYSNYAYASGFGGTPGGTGGGAIHFNSDNESYYLTITDSTFSYNRTGNNDGGAVYAEDGYLTITGSTFDHNYADDDGGALGSDDALSLSIAGCTFEYNRAYGSGFGGGGAIWMKEMNGPATIQSSYFRDNYSNTDGGALSFNFDTDEPLTISDSYIEDNTANGGNGGGLFAYGGNVIISQSTISGNEGYLGGGVGTRYGSLTVSGCTLSGNDSYRGGGLFTLFMGSTVLTGSTFDDNYAYDDGGGINLAIVSGPVLISNCAATNNYSRDDGGGIYFYALRPNSPLTIANTTIHGNTSYDDGGGIGGFALAYNSNVTLFNCTVSSNTSTTDDGGGLAIDGIYFYSAVNIDRCRFLNNTCADRGGGVYFAAYYYYDFGFGGPDTGNGLLTIRNSTINGNTTSGPNSLGGGIYCFSADSGQASQVLQIENSTISNNTSIYPGGGLWFSSYYAGCLLANSTVSGNQCLDGVGGGAVVNVVNLYEGCYIENCTFYDNYADGPGGGLFFVAGNPRAVEVSGSIISGNDSYAFAPDIFGPYGTINFTSSLVGHPYYVASYIIGPGNIFYQYAYLEPLASNGGPTKTHALSVSSPAIDSGINAALAPFDQRGNGYPRTVNGQTDMGAFEYNPDAPPPSELFGFGGDSDGDGDGFSDDAEDAAGTAPNDPTDTPLGSILSSTDQIEPLSVLKLQVSLKFSKPGSDTIKVKGRFELPEGTPVAGETVLVDVAGNSVAFQLDDNPRGAKGVSGLSKIKVGAPKGGVASFLLLLKGDFQATCAQNADLQNETTDKVGEARIIRVALLFGQEAVFRTDVVTSYKAKQDKTGKAK